MKHYHGLPITPATAAYEAVKQGHAFVSFAHKQQLGVAIEVCQSFAIDNGAFSAWKSGNPVQDWTEFYNFALDCMKYPHCDWIVIPDVIDGNEADIGYRNLTVQIGYVCWCRGDKEFVI